MIPNVNSYSQSPENLISHINNAADLLNALESLSSGDKITLCFSFANQSPQAALGTFAEILQEYKDGDWRLRTLALRGLTQLGCEATLEDMKRCDSESAAQILQLFKEELHNARTGNELTRWAAAEAIKLVEYSPHTLNQAGIPRSADEYMREIEERMIVNQRRIKRLDSRKQHTVEYDDYLNFWIFGPVQRLFQERYPDENDIEKVLNSLSVYGIVQSFATFNANEEIQRQFVFPKLKKLAEFYLQDPVHPWLIKYLEYFLKQDQISQKNISRFAQILTFQYLAKPIDSLDNETMEELSLGVDCSNLRLFELERDKNIIRSLSQFQRVEKFCIEDYNQYLQLEKTWKLEIERKIRDFLKLVEILDFNQRLIAEFRSSLESTIYSEIRELQIRSSTSICVTKESTYSLLVSEYQFLHAVKNEAQRQLANYSRSKSEEISEVTAEIELLEESVSRFGMISVGFFIAAALAEVIAVILFILFVIISIIIAAIIIIVAMFASSSGG